MPSDAPIRVRYAERFHCIGSACEDTCCQGWTVPIDGDAWVRYRGLPDGGLRDLIEAGVELTPQAAEGDDAASPFAMVRLNASNRCPMLTAEGLCRIHAELGAGMLSHACATYPRLTHALGCVEERALALSCPEAARIVLMGGDLLDMTEPQAGEGVNEPLPQEASLPPNFWAIRRGIFQVLRARTYPLWQRLFLIYLLCQRLDAIERGELNRSVPALLGDFELAVETGSLRAAMETLPVNRTAQLDIVLRLAGMMLHKSNMLPRFQECVKQFTAGIGNGPGATLESLAAHYAWAHDRCFAPLMSRHPFLLENLVVNAIVRCQFPFGVEAIRNGTQPRMTREFGMLAAQFVLMRGLLIGVAGNHGTSFSTVNVVETVQAASKHFEHHPEFLKMAHALLVESRMDGARGVAILLRNAAMENAGMSRGRDVEPANPSAQSRPCADRPDGKPASAPGLAG